MSFNLYESLQDFVSQLPEFAQPLVVAVLGMIPYVEGEGSAALGIVFGINPLAAAVAGAAGNILAVILVVLLSSRVRESVVAKRKQRAVAAGAQTSTGVLYSSTYEPNIDTSTNKSYSEVAHSDRDDAVKSSRRSRGRQRLSRWLTKFGVPGASILAPWVLPTQLTAAFFVASGVEKGWVILWQIVAILLWTSLVAAAALGVVNILR